VLVFLATLVILHGDGKASLPHVLVIYHGSGVFAYWGLVVFSCILLRARHVFFLPTVGLSLVLGLFFHAILSLCFMGSCC